jgi:hypothetical protein
MLAGILSLLVGLVFGLSRSRARSHSAVSVPVFCPGSLVDIDLGRCF